MIGIAVTGIRHVPVSNFCRLASGRLSDFRVTRFGVRRSAASDGDIRRVTHECRRQDVAKVDRVIPKRVGTPDVNVPRN